MVASLLTYLHYQYGDDIVDEFFMKDAQLRVAGLYWDEEEQCVHNANDAHVSSLLDDLDDDYILPPVKKKGSTNDQPAPAHPNPTFPPSNATHSAKTMILSAPSDATTQGTLLPSLASTPTLPCPSPPLLPTSLPWRNSSHLIISPSLPIYRPQRIPRIRPRTGRVATISTMAGHVASWQ